MLIDQHLEHFVTVVDEGFLSEIDASDLFAVHDCDDLQLLAGRLFNRPVGGFRLRRCLGRRGGLNWARARTYPHENSQSHDRNHDADTLKLCLAGAQLRDCRIHPGHDEPLLNSMRSIATTPRRGLEWGGSIGKAAESGQRQSMTDV